MSGLTIYAKLCLYSKLLIAAQKNVLFVGAPGTGKTRLATYVARLCTKDLADPETVVGRDGLSYDRLVAYYVVEKGTPILRLGPLARSIVDSWARIGLGLGPRYILFDEINRCNVDVLLGEVFTALDIEHRMRIPVVRDPAYEYLKKLVKEGRGEDIGLDSEGLKIVEKVLEEVRRRNLDGVPMPYAFRILATMNVYDRAQLYRLGYALLRRFACIYVPTPFEDLEPRLYVEELERNPKPLKQEDLKVLENVEKQLKNSRSSIVSTAIRELTIDGSLLDNDYPAAPFTRLNREEVVEAFKNATDRFGNAIKLVSYVYTVALRRLGIELGISTLVDVAKLMVIAEIASTSKSVVSEPELVDLALSSLVLPHLGAVAPKLRSELLMVTHPEESKLYRALRDLVEKLSSILGEENLSMKVLNSLEIPNL